METAVVVCEARKEIDSRAMPTSGCVAKEGGKEVKKKATRHLVCIVVALEVGQSKGRIWCKSRH